MKQASVADTICDTSIFTPLQSTPIDPPTMSITITVNTSPFAGLEGTKITSTNIRKRLMAEAETNVAITFMENENKDSFEIGDAEMDNCEVCDNDNENNCKRDCKHVWGGNSELDNCGICDEDPSNNCTQDCNGDWGFELNEAD